MPILKGFAFLRCFVAMHLYFLNALMNVNKKIKFFFIDIIINSVFLVFGANIHSQNFNQVMRNSVRMN